MRRLVAVLALICAGCEPAPEAAAGGPPEAAAVASAGLGLRLDLGGRRLDLHHDGVLLRSYEVGSVDIGRPRWSTLGTASAFPAPGPWIPERRSPRLRREAPVVAAPGAGAADPSGAVEWIPLRPEELNPDPARLRVVYAGGLTLDLLADDAPAPRWAGLNAGYVVRVRMARDALGMFHRSLGDSVPLVLLSPPLPQRPGAPDG